MGKRKGKAPKQNKTKVKARAEPTTSRQKEARATAWDIVACLPASPLASSILFTLQVLAAFAALSLSAFFGMSQIDTAAKDTVLPFFGDCSQINCLSASSFECDLTKFVTPAQRLCCCRQLNGQPLSSSCLVSSPRMIELKHAITTGAKINQHESWYRLGVEMLEKGCSEDAVKLAFSSSVESLVPETTYIPGEAGLWRYVPLHFLDDFESLINHSVATNNRRIGDSDAPEHNWRSRSHVTGKWKIDHDVEQLKYILRSDRQRKLSFSETTHLKSALMKFETAQNFMKFQEDSVPGGLPEGAEIRVPINNSPLKDIIGDVFGKHVWHHPFDYPAFSDPADGPLNPEVDWEDVENKYLASSPNIVVVDDFLSPKCLMLVREWLNEGTMWHDVREGYLGAYWDDGLAAPLLLQIASEMRRHMPRIFAKHPLIMNWAYKYDPRHSRKGINVHADGAQVNVNLWLTDLEQNISPASNNQTGGLQIYHEAPAAGWKFEDFNKEIDKSPKAKALMARSKSTVVHHKANRISIFQSDLLHNTDGVPFKAPDAFDKWRINLTYLFGQGKYSK